MTHKDIRKIYKIHMLYFNKTIILCLLQIVTIYNAIKLGWEVTKVRNRTYEFRKKFVDGHPEDINLINLVNTIVSLKLVA